MFPVLQERKPVLIASTSTCYSKEGQGGDSHSAPLPHSKHQNERKMLVVVIRMSTIGIIWRGRTPFSALALVSMYVCKWVSLSVCVCAHACARMCAHVWVCVCVRENACMYACVYLVPHVSVLDRVFLYYLVWFWALRLKGLTCLLLLLQKLRLRVHTTSLNFPRIPSPEHPDDMVILTV